MTFAVNLATVGSNATATGTLLQSGTAVASTSGTSIDFTSIPSWVKRITVMLNGVSTNGTSPYLIRLGAGSIEATGYISGAQTNGGNVFGGTTGFAFLGVTTAAEATNGAMTLLNISGLIWVMSSATGRSDGGAASSSGGTKTLAGTLTQIRLTTVNGTDTFDAGSINILYE